MRKNLYLTILIAILLFAINACSTDDNPVEQQPPTSVINGNWESASWTSTGGGITDSLVVNLTLHEEEGVVSGTGTVNALFQDSSNSISVAMTGDVVGVYSDPNINITLTNSISGDKYTYSGSWKTQNKNFNGTGAITTLGRTNIYSELSMFLVQ